MESSIKAAWVLLALLHATPALAAFAPSVVERLYGVPPNGDVGVLLVHRGALFLAVFVTALYAAFDPASRRLATLVVAISMLGFLVIYARAGLPEGDLRRIAIADVIGLAPLFWVAFRAWR